MYLGYVTPGLGPILTEFALEANPKKMGTEYHVPHLMVNQWRRASVYTDEETNP